MYRLPAIIVASFAFLLSSCAVADEDEEYSYASSIESWQARETRRPEHKGPHVEPELWEILEISTALHEGWEDRVDREKWGREDYWQTYDESRVSMSGDCEDYAIYLYITLLMQGYPPDCIAPVIFERPMEDGSIKGHCDLCWFTEGPGFTGHFYRFMGSACQSSEFIYMDGWRVVGVFTLDTYLFY